MPFALLFIGVLLIVTGFQNTYPQFGTLVAGDFTGNGNFIYWMIAIGIIGSVGYVKELQGFSRAGLVLLLLVMVLSNKGFFSQINNAVNQGTATPDTQIGANVPSSAAASGSPGSGATSSSASGITGAAKLVDTGASLLSAFF